MTGYWVGDPGDVDDFGHPITDEFIDGATGRGPWAIMSPMSWRLYGSGSTGKLGQGIGQRYKKQVDGKWLKVEG